MRSVRSQEQANRPSAELVALLKRQSELQALEKKLKSIERAIEEQNAKIEKARAAVPSIQAIEARIGDLLASEAAGHITEKEREEREAALSKEAAKVRAAAAEASSIVSRVQATISGLDAQRRNVMAEIARAHRKCHDALDAYLMAEAERIGQAYLALAKNLYDKFLQLLAIDRLHRSSTGEGGRYGRITGLDSQALVLPAFRVGGCTDHAVGNAKSRLFTEGGMTIDRPIEEAIKSERARLDALGVALSWNGSRFRASEEPDEQTDEERSAEAA